MIGVGRQTLPLTKSVCMALMNATDISNPKRGKPGESALTGCRSVFQGALLRISEATRLKIGRPSRHLGNSQASRFTPSIALIVLLAVIASLMRDLPPSKIGAGSKHC